MMHPRVCALVLGLALASAAHAPVEASPQPAAGRPDPMQQALVQMVGEAQTREAQALVQVYTLRAELTETKARLEAETARADAAEVKLKALDAPNGAAAAK